MGKKQVDQAVPIKTDDHRQAANVQNNNWKKASIILAVLLSLTLICCAYQKEGGNRPDDASVRHDLACFVKNIKSVSSDPIIIRSNLETAYAFTTLKAKKQLDKMIRELNLSDKLSHRITVTIDINSAKLTNSSTCFVAWTQTVYEGNKQLSHKVYEGYFRLKFAPPIRTGKGYLDNPHGVYINNIDIKESVSNIAKS